MVVDQSVLDDQVVQEPPPLLVVEITSPSTRSDDWGTKFQSYAAYGAKWYWVVNLDVPDFTVLENVSGAFVERLRTGEPCTPDPYEVQLDPSRFGCPTGTSG